MNKNINIVIAGVSYFSSMASAMRVRTLFKPMTFKNNISLNNIIFSTPQLNHQFENYKGNEHINYKIISYNLVNVFSIISFIIKCFLAVKKLRNLDCNNALYVYGYPDLRTIFLVLYAKLFDYKIIFDITEDNYTVTDFKGITGKVRNYSSLFFIRRISDLANGVIVISSHLKEKLTYLSKQNIPIELIPASVDFQYYQSVKLSQNGNIKLFYGGTFGEKDSIELLMDAFETISQSHKNISLIMTGKGSERDMIKFNKLLKIKSSKCNIIYKGYLSVEDYFDTLNQCDIMCVIRSGSAFANAGFPFKLTEYLASGKAVIATDVSDIQYYLKNNVNAVIINPESKKDLVDAIEKLITNKNLRIKIGQEGRKTARNYFDNIVVTDKFLSFINNKVL